MAPSGYGCSFVVKLRRKKNYFLTRKIFVYFTKYILFAEKRSFYTKQKFYAEKKLLLKKIFFQKKTGEIYFYSDFHYFLVI